MNIIHTTRVQIAHIRTRPCQAVRRVPFVYFQSTRAVTLIARNHKGRTGGRAETAMNTFTKNGISFGDLRVGKLVSGKMSLHKPCPLDAVVHTAKIKNRPRVKRCLYPLVKRIMR